MLLLLALFVYGTVVLFVFMNSVMEFPYRYERLASNLWLISAVAVLWPLIALVLPFSMRARSIATVRRS